MFKLFLLGYLAAGADSDSILDLMSDQERAVYQVPRPCAADASQMMKAKNTSASEQAMYRAARKFGARSAIVTQAIMKFNSGKRVRYIGSAYWEDTGKPVKSTPKKFLPAQVLRRQASN